MDTKFDGSLREVRGHVKGEARESGRLPFPDSLAISLGEVFTDCFHDQFQRIAFLFR
jgi:hypothetical protein